MSEVEFKLGPTADRAAARQGGMLDLTRRNKDSSSAQVWLLSEEDVESLYSITRSHLILKGTIKG